MIAVSPAGSISFISHLWGGRVSDKYLTQCSRFLQLLEPGDTVLADRGFNIADDIGLHGGELAMPASSQLEGGRVFSETGTGQNSRRASDWADEEQVHTTSGHITS